MASRAAMKMTLIVDDELSLLGLQRQMPEELPINGIDVPETFMNQAGMALNKARRRGMPSL